MRLFAERQAQANNLIELNPQQCSSTDAATIIAAKTRLFSRGKDILKQYLSRIPIIVPEQ